MAISPDGRTVLTGGGGKPPRLWNVATGQPVGAPLRHPGTLRRAVIGPECKTVLIDGPGRTASLWDTATGQSIGQPVLRGQSTGQPVLHKEWDLPYVVFSPDGKTIFIQDPGRLSTLTAALWDTATGQRVGQLLKHAWSTALFAFTPDSKILSVAQRDGTTCVCDTAAGQLIREMPPQYPGSSIALSPGGQDILINDAWGTRVREIAARPSLGRQIPEQGFAAGGFFGLNYTPVPPRNTKMVLARFRLGARLKPLPYSLDEENP